MAELFSDTVRLMLSQLTFKIDSNSNDLNLTCGICNKLMIDAYQSYCECQFCRDCVVEYLSDKEKNCPGSKGACLEQKLKVDVNVSRNSFLNWRILQLKVYCPNQSCMCVEELKTMAAHLRVCEKTQPEFLCLIESIVDGTMISTVFEKLTHHKLQINDLKQDKKNIEEIFEGLRVEVDKQKKDIDSLRENSFMKNEADTIFKSIIEERLHISKLVDSIDKMKKDLHSNVISFTVDGFTKKMSGTDEIIGPYFYSHLNGYKLQLRIFPGGIRKRKGTHLSLFFVLCKGEYDNILPWPCKYTINIGVVNQMNNKTHRGRTYDYSTILDDHKFLFHKPVDKDNEVCGCSDFISHKDLTTITGLINDNTVIIQCVVSAPS